jgi:hypothetical protein
MSICSKRKQNRDVLKHCFRFQCDNAPDPERQDLWISNGILNACGTFVLMVEESCGGVQVFVNDEEVTVDDTGVSVPLEDGDTLALTVDDLSSIQVICNTTSGLPQFCIVNFCLTLNYQCC